MILKNTPTVSIITVSFNAHKTLEDTILSVINQDCDDVEYIIIDGGSTDGTVDIIKKYQDRITFWVSEPDKGIYDAMNKGTSISNGNWILFLNSGDLLLENVLNPLIKRINNNYSIIYGNIKILHKGDYKIRYPKNINSLHYTMPFCHQAVIVKKSLLIKSTFNINYKLSSDFEFFLKNINQNFLYVPLTLVEYDLFGLSNKMAFDMMKEYFTIIRSFHTSLETLYYCTKLILLNKTFILKSIFIKIFGLKFFNFINFKLLKKH